MDGPGARAIVSAGGRSRQNHDRSGPTRARLLTAAADAFAAKGFHGTSTRDIAAAAGISPTAMYAHHASKEELLYLLAKRAHDRVLTVIDQALDPSRTPAQQLWQLVHDFAIHHASTHVVSKVANYELAALSEEHFDEIRTLRRVVTGRFRDVIEAGIRVGEFETSNPRLAIFSLVSQSIDISRWYDESGIPAEDIATAYAEMAVRSLAAGRR